MRTQMDRLLADLTGLPGLLGGWPSAMELLPVVWSPPVDISETDDAWILEAEVPGANREDIVIEVRDRQLVIHGEVKEAGARRGSGAAGSGASTTP
jgi:HSP20 family protein